MQVGDEVMVGREKGTVVVAEPLNDTVVVKLTDGAGADYYSTVNVSAVSAVKQTYRADTPHGQVTIDLPVDGNPEVKAVWSKAATDAVVTKVTT